MATRRKSIFGRLIPDPANTAGPFDEHLSVPNTNDLYKRLAYAFGDTSSKLSLVGTFGVPSSYVNGAKFGIDYITTLTTGDVRFVVDYTAIADAETLDPAAHQETVEVTSTVPGTARLRKYVELTPTASNFVANDIVECLVSRNSGHANDNAAGTIYIVDVQFIWNDA